jgi:hypothetical protein
MVYNACDCWGVGLFPSSYILKNTIYQKLDLCPASDEEAVGKCSLVGCHQSVDQEGNFILRKE